MLVFDLDGTLTPSKGQMSEEIQSVLQDLYYKGYELAIISGCNISQFNEQISYSLLKEVVYLLPTSGAAMYLNGSLFYKNELNLREKFYICGIWTDALSLFHLHEFLISDSYGEIAEDRGSQITFSMLGQAAPLEEKRKWDPDQTIRKEIVRNMNLSLGENFDIKIGGTTSIDVTKKGINKAYGIRQLSRYSMIDIKDMLFIGDALYPGGNDEVVKETGIETIQVSGPEETLKLLKNILNEIHN